MPKHILVILREVWDTRALGEDALDASGRPRPDRLGTMMEPEDLNALEMALKLRDAREIPVTVVSFGDPLQVDVLRESLYRGADAVIRLGDKEGRVADALGRAALLAEMVKKKGPFDLILMGVDVPEGENAHAGSHCAALLGIPQVTYVEDIESVEDETVVVRRAIEGGTQSVRVQLPAVLTVGVALTKDDPRTPRTARARLKLQHKKTPIPMLTPVELGIPEQELAPVVALKGHEAVPRQEIHTTRIDAEDEEALRGMIERLRADRVL